jgi:hypothetical protein
MKRNRLAAITTALALATTAALALRPGETAPDFRGTDSNGKTETLAQYRGKFVVLEWANQGCPYEQKHYKSGNMEGLQKQWTSKGVVWLSVISSAPGQQGYVTPAEENDYLSKMHAAPTAAILDPQGKIVYEGAIDDQPTPDPASLKAVQHNYLNEALDAAMGGKPVATPVTKSYGCSVKYGS